jgi:hypothetical protein
MGNIQKQETLTLENLKKNVLVPCLLNVFTDDTDECVVGNTTIIKFVDETKIFRIIKRVKDREELQQTLDN